MDMQQLLGYLQNPQEEFTPIPFWFFNDKPDRKIIKQQLEDFTDKGVNALVLHPRIGIPEEIPYLSKAYFDAVRYVVETAAGLHMKIVLYDEGMYPSGSAHGMVVEANPEYAAQGIIITDEAGTDPVITLLPGGRYLVKRKTKGTIRGIHFGEDDGEAKAPAAADILNPAAVAQFIHLTHDRYYEELKPYFGTTIIGFFTDEPCALGRNAEHFREWADGMEQEITEAGGSLQELEGLFTGQENATTNIYHKLIKRHLRETFYGALHRWCEEHGIWLMGHPAESDDVEEELYFHVPGQDLIMRRVSPETGGLLEPDSVQAKLPADIARHLGRKRNANECFGVCCRHQIPWYFTGMDMKWYINWLGIRGVNLFIPHAFYYSVEGQRKEERPPDVGPNNIWWNHYRLFSDYIKRISWLMTDSVNGAKIAVLCDNNRIPFRETAALYENQIEFNYLPVSLLKDCRIEEQVLRIREYGYEVVLNVLEKDYDESLPGIKVVHDEKELLKEHFQHLRTVKTSEPCPSLRAAVIWKGKIRMHLLSNEGNEKIHTRIWLPGGASLLAMDLWKGAFCPVPADDQENDAWMEAELEPCEMLLIIHNGADEGIQENFTVSSHNLAGMIRDRIPNWNQRFTLQKKEHNKAEYQYSFEAEEISGTEIFEVTGEEMAECLCNGQPAGVSFMNPHRFEIGTFLKKGNNTIQLIFTGNAANQYENADIFYGCNSFS